MWPQANIKLVSVHTESVSLVTQLDIWVSGAHRICGGNKRAAQKNLPRATQDTGNQPWVWILRRIASQFPSHALQLADNPTTRPMLLCLPQPTQE